MLCIELGLTLVTKSSNVREKGPNMKSSESMAKIAGALVKAQKDIDSAKKDAKNPFFKSKYANLESVIDACKDALNTQGITILQPHKHEEVRAQAYSFAMRRSGVQFPSGPPRKQPENTCLRAALRQPESCGVNSTGSP